ncbi:MAG: hypothetical protein GQ558_10035 [Thermoplasmata archaeon]|nr:hypothetical protein [Thermoplasmata archaeon]
MPIWRKRPKAPSKTEVEYEPRSVKDLLVEMKDSSELIVDLAYSAVIFDSDEFLEQVLQLEERLDQLQYQIRIQIMMATRTREDAEEMIGILQVASAAEQLGNAAEEIARLVEEDVEYRPFLPFVMREADETIGTVRLDRTSEITGQTPYGLGLESAWGIRIIALKRGRRWWYEVDDDRGLRAGDLLVFRGTGEGVDLFRKVALGKATIQEVMDNG